MSYKIVSLFFIMLLTYGCHTLELTSISSRRDKSSVMSVISSATDINNKRKKQLENITHDVAFFSELYQVDLDDDGEKDIIAVYVDANNKRKGLKVIIIKPDEAKVVYQNLFSSMY